MRGTVEAGALALQRVLALEGRDVLSRVELAASALDRFELAPALAHQIDAIRAAVGELDTLLDKIERLSDPLRSERTAGEARLAPVLAALAVRLAPTLAARGVRLEATGAGPARAVAVPEAVLERLVLTWLRAGIAALAGATDGAEETPIVLELEGRDHEDAVELVLRVRGVGSDRRLALARADQVELDVALAEWRGRALRLDEGGGEALGLRLPACGRSGDA
ncbi:MAG: hypothetical protein U0900_00575 [Myxococcota bacterium]